MKRLAALFVLVSLAGCAKQESAFQHDLRVVSAESQRTMHLVEMGASATEQASQLTGLRKLIAGLSPVTDEERKKTKSAKELLKELEDYAYDARQVNQKTYLASGDSVDQADFDTIKQGTEASQHIISRLLGEINAESQQ
jgi:hypothetical protein